MAVTPSVGLLSTLEPTGLLVYSVTDLPVAVSVTGRSVLLEYGPFTTSIISEEDGPIDLKDLVGFINDRYGGWITAELSYA